ncbi:MAG: s-methyl-5-thioribose-1-phosphate isomerase, partial [Acidobacteriota bacterium]
MRVEGRWRRTIELAADRRGVIVLDQAKLPYAIEWLPLRTLGDVARAIKDMHVRGAPLIGATAAYGVAIALANGDVLDTACDALAATRPTAINLRWALGQMREGLAAGKDAWALAAAIADGDVAQCEAIGSHGLSLFRSDRVNRVLTHCNAGWLATVDWGTALAPIYKAHEAGYRVHVWVDETRPRNQGLLTAWELAQHGEVDLCIVGTDRTTRNGDVCNKIGTYLKALAAHDNGVPFYAAVPGSSIDWTVGEPHEIPIEERDGAAAAVVCSMEKAKQFTTKPIRVAASVLTSDPWTQRDLT